MAGGDTDGGRTRGPTGGPPATEELRLIEDVRIDYAVTPPRGSRILLVPPEGQDERVPPRRAADALPPRHGKPAAPPEDDHPSRPVCLGTPLFTSDLDAGAAGAERERRGARRATARLARRRLLAIGLATVLGALAIVLWMALRAS